jgi:hypothetical protein
MYTAAITAVLADYEPEVIKRATDPRTGIAQAMPTLPNPAEIRTACDVIVKARGIEPKMNSTGWAWKALKMTDEGYGKKIWESSWRKTGEAA